MEKLSAFELNDFIAILKESKELQGQLDDFIEDCEMDFLSEKLDALRDGLRDYSVGFGGHSFIERKSGYDFLSAVRNLRDSYGLTERGDKKLVQCEKLYDCSSNLLEAELNKLQIIVWEDEFEKIITYVDDASYAIYCDDFENQILKDYIELFIESGLCDKYLYDSETKKIYKEV